MKIIKALMSFCIILVTCFTFAGCSWFDFSGLNPGGSGGSGGGSEGGIQTPPSGEITPVDPGIEGGSEEDKQETLLQYVNSTQGVRAVYMPKAQEISSDLSLQSDRNKFFENTTLQYEIIAEYVLHCLFGEYGSGAVEAKNIVYEYFADDSLLPAGESKDTLIYLPAKSPKIKNNKLMESNVGAIWAPVVGIEYGLAVDGEGRSYYVEPVKNIVDSSLKWNMSADSYEEFLAMYKEILQINLMQFDLGYIPTNVNVLMEMYSADDRLEMLNGMAREIDRLGVGQTKDHFDYLYNYILNNIIGRELVLREDEEIVYNDIYYEKYEQTGVEIEQQEVNGEIVDVEVPVFEYVKYWYDISGLGAGERLVSSTAYKFGYREVASEIAEAVFGRFSDSGEIERSGFVNEYPTFSRAEIVDVNVEEFYKNMVEESTDEQIVKFGSMDYQEYQSVVMYNFDNTKYDEEGKVVIDTELIKWVFDTLYINIDSKNDITLDIYGRVKQGDSNTFMHLTRMNTKSSAGADFSDENPNLEFESVEWFFDATKTNYRSCYLFDYIPQEDWAVLITGELNREKKDKFLVEEEDAYKNTFLAKLGSKGCVEQSGSDMKFTNYFGEEINFADKFLCQEEGNFFEIIFDVKKSQGQNYDYGFKFMIYTSLWEITEEDENAQTA